MTRIHLIETRNDAGHWHPFSDQFALTPEALNREVRVRNRAYGDFAEVYRVAEYERVEVDSG